MPTWIKSISIITVLLSFVGLLYYIYIATAGLQKSMDLVGRLQVMIFGTSTVLFGLFTILLLSKYWFASNKAVNLSIITISLLLLANCAPFYEPFYTNKGQTRSVKSDISKMTEDGKYKYHLELINMYQKNGYERLVIENTDTNKVRYIKIDLIEGRLKGFFQDDWVLMYSADELNQPNLYYLKTTENLFMATRLFLIDLEMGTVQEIK